MIDNKNFYLLASICEYDIHAANIAILKDLDIISTDIYNEYLIMDKDQRVYHWGMMVKEDPSIYVKVKERLNEVMDTFIKSNNIKEENIIEKVFDGIWVKNTKCRKLEYGDYITFVPKREYTSMMVFGGFKYYYNSIAGVLDSRHTTEVMRNRMDNFIKKAMAMKEAGMSKELYIYCHEYLIENPSLIKYIKMILEIMEV